MKLSSTSLLFAVALLSVNNNNIVLGQTEATDANGDLPEPCGEFDTVCSGEYRVPDAPSICREGVKTTDSCKVPCIINGISYVCDNGVFVQGGVGAGFTSDPTATPKPPCGTPEECSGTAVITGTAVVISKDSEETDVSGIDIGIDDSAASTTASTIVSSIVGIAAAVGVFALLLDQHWDRGATGNNGFQVIPTANNASAVTVNELSEWNTHLFFNCARVVDVTRNAEEFSA